MIVASALRIHGVVYSLPLPSEHHHVIAHVYEKTKMSPSNFVAAEQGYLDDSGVFLDRHQAFDHALRSGQVKSPVPGERSLDARHLRP